MKAGLPQREPAILSLWDAEKIYDKIRAARKGSEKFVLHDGPPYANGDIHGGTEAREQLNGRLLLTVFEPIGLIGIFGGQAELVFAGGFDLQHQFEIEMFLELLIAGFLRVVFREEVEKFSGVEPERNRAIAGKCARWQLFLRLLHRAGVHGMAVETQAHFVLDARRARIAFEFDEHDGGIVAQAEGEEAALRIHVAAVAGADHHAAVRERRRGVR